ncbi:MULTISPECIES: L-fucose:H+ symporter permease [unclassified Sphingomonas]|uniref:L-fucose:H+ symporter permease n=1 Tax=Sphingomonas TaxID=13687 RepID=UPI0009623272|nr:MULTISPECIES: L-fucose:H+ symporter permease [unclassified Sphingomonas]MBN8813662.1 L-fucose:H+ symporter permease [Sphingomonas sp.]OJY54085.1 MAG: L-fucose:H+ symporter permease [Sphingomonas sp. 67-41]
MASRAFLAAPPIVERRYAVAFALVTSLFFSWALAAALNDVLIRQFQKALDLTRTEASLIQFAFYIGYFCAAVPAGLLIRRLGYKNTILIGLACYAGGAFLFYPAASTEMFGLFLAALYVIAIGLAFLETASNPYITILGARETASARLNLAQSFYGVGAIIGPIVGGLFIFSTDERTQAQIAAMAPAERAAWRSAAAAAVQGPYVAIGVVVCLLALLIACTRFPVLDRAKAMPGNGRSMFAVLRHRGLLAAIAALFLYVGAQVGVWSFFIDFTKIQAPHLSERTAAFLLSGSLGMLMIGRFSGAFLQKRIAPARLLAIYAAANIMLCGFAAIATGMPAVGALWLTSFFMSIMFPTIFALGVEGLDDETESGAAFLVMAIIGGALLPPLMGIVSEGIGGIHHMMFVPMLAFVGVLAFALLRLREGRAA